MEEIMGTPFYHTDESALKTIEDYRDTQGYYTIEEALACMANNIDELDNEDRGALNHYRRINK
jgi:hypothetical protein